MNNELCFKNQVFNKNSVELIESNYNFAKFLKVVCGIKMVLTKMKTEGIYKKHL